MEWNDHVSLVAGALKDWFVARLWDSLLITGVWWVGLRALHVPLAPLWAILAGLFQFVPHIGPVVALVGPAIAAAIAGGEERFFLVLGLYAAITLVNGLAIEPLLFKRVARIPVWASLLVPIALGLVFSIWGVVLAAPLLAVYYAYWARAGRNRSHG
jgi:predicted PurR-regulated permease PerM